MQVLLFILLAAMLAGCGDASIQCARWTVREEVISVYPMYLTGPVKRCAEWVVVDG